MFLGLLVFHTQCGTLAIFLLLRFYVKSIIVNNEYFQRLLFQPNLIFRAFKAFKIVKTAVFALLKSAKIEFT